VAWPQSILRLYVKNSLKEIIVKIIRLNDWIKKTNLADCDRDVGSFLNDGGIRT
jgi:hypothetical protein